MSLASTYVIVTWPVPCVRRPVQLGRPSGRPFVCLMVGEHGSCQRYQSGQLCPTMEVIIRMFGGVPCGVSDPIRSSLGLEHLFAQRTPWLPWLAACCSGSKAADSNHFACMACIVSFGCPSGQMALVLGWVRVVHKVPRFRLPSVRSVRSVRPSRSAVGRLS